MDMLMRVVDDGMSTRLYHRLCDDQGLSYDVSAAYDGYVDAGVLDFAAGCAHERVARITHEILAMTSELGASGPTAAELDKARRRCAWDMRALDDAPEDLAALLALGHLQGGMEAPDARAARNVAVTAGEIAGVARLVARPERLNVMAVGLLDRAEEARVRAIVRAFA
jgi:predicted Zn-dependent peptidase